MKLPPRGRCVQCGGILRAERWRCWICRIFAQMYPEARNN